MSELVSQAAADAEQERSIREWLDGMTPDQRRALIDASNRRLAQLKAKILAEIHAEGITEQEWIARQHAAYAVAQAGLKGPDNNAPQASIDESSKE